MANLNATLYIPTSYSDLNIPIIIESDHAINNKIEDENIIGYDVFKSVL